VQTTTPAKRVVEKVCRKFKSDGMSRRHDCLLKPAPLLQDILRPWIKNIFSHQQQLQWSVFYCLGIFCFLNFCLNTRFLKTTKYFDPPLRPAPRIAYPNMSPILCYFSNRMCTDKYCLLFVYSLLKYFS